MAAAPATPTDYKKTFDEVGYVIIPDLIPAESRAELEAATERVVAKTRSGEWPHRRVVGKVRWLASAHQRRRSCGGLRSKHRSTVIPFIWTSVKVSSQAALRLRSVVKKSLSFREGRGERAARGRANAERYREVKGRASGGGEGG